MQQKGYTFFGIFLSYTTISGVNWLFKAYNGKLLTDRQVISKELLILALVGLLLWLIVKGEKQSLRSIGLYPQGLLKSVGLSLILTVLTFLAVVLALFIIQQIGWSYGESKAFDNLSLWTLTLVTIRAGVAEEVFMRGYLIERITTLSGSQTIAVLASLVPFALLHYAGQGWAGVLISFAAGAVLTGFYLWKRDLKANILAHFLVDFIPNVAAQWF